MWRKVAYTIAQKLALLAATLVFVSLLVFALLRVIGDVPVPFFSEITPEQRAELEKELSEDLGTEGPLYRQYLDFVGDALRADLNESWYSGIPVQEALVDRLPATAELLVLSLAVSTAIALAGAIMARRYRSADWLIQSSLIIGASVPIFLSATLVLLVPAEKWGYVPPRLGEYVPIYDAPWTNLRTFGPLALLIGITSCLGPLRYLRTALDGSTTTSVSQKILLLAGAVSLALPAAAGGAIVVELISSIRGVGLLYFQSAFVLDFPPAQFLFLYAVLFAVSLRILISPTTFGEIAASAPRVRPGTNVWRKPGVMIGLALVATVGVIAVVGPYLTPDNPITIRIGSIKAGPSWDHPFGTDDIGRDLFSRVIVGARTSLKYAAIVASLGYMPGWIAGRLGRRTGMRTRRLLQYIVSASAALPLLWVLLALRVAFGPGPFFEQVLWALGIFAFFHGLGVAQGSSRSLPPMATRASEAHLLARSRAWLAQSTPVVGPEIVMGACEVFATSILMLSLLDFLGLGVSSPTASWGDDVGRAVASFPTAYHWLLFPGAALCIAIFAFNLLASSLRDALERPTEGGSA